MFYDIIIKASIQVYNYTVDGYMKNIPTQRLFHHDFCILCQLISEGKKNRSVHMRSSHAHFSCFLHVLGKSGYAGCKLISMKCIKSG